MKHVGNTYVYSVMSVIHITRGILRLEKYDALYFFAAVYVRITQSLCTIECAMQFQYFLVKSRIPRRMRFVSPITTFVTPYYTPIHITHCTYINSSERDAATRARSSRSTARHAHLPQNAEASHHVKMRTYVMINNCT